MTGKHRDNEPHIVGAVSPAMETALIMQAANAGKFDRQHKERVEHQVADAQRTLDQNAYANALQEHLRDELSEEFRRTRRPYGPDEFHYNRAMVQHYANKHSDEVEEVLRKVRDPAPHCSIKGTCKKEVEKVNRKIKKTGMSLPIDQVTQMRNRAKKGNGSRKPQKKQRKKNRKPRVFAVRSKGMSVYTAPAAVGTEFINDFPKTETRTKNGRRIHFREPVAILTNSEDFDNCWINCNPGDYTVFKWLSKIAGAYEKYKFYSLRFWYAAGCPSTQPGQSFAYPDYDPNDSQAGSYVTAMENQNSIQFTPWKSMVGPEMITADIRNSPPLLIYHGKMANVDLGNDYPLYNYLSAWIANQGGDDLTQTGTVYLEYDVELMHETGEGQSASLITNSASDATTAKPLGYDSANAKSYQSAPIVSATRNAGLLTNTGNNGSKYLINNPGVVDVANQSIYFHEAFAGLIFVKIVGAMTGNLGTQQISIASYLGTGGTTISAAVVIANGGTNRIEGFAVYASPGTQLQFSLSGGLTITTTAVSKLTLSGGDSTGGTSSRGYLAAQSFLSGSF